MEGAGAPGMGWGLGKPIYYLIGYLLPIAYATIAYCAVWIFGLGGVDISLLGGNFWSALLSSLTFGVLLSLTLAVGEEIGWRGLLVPQLARIHPFAQTALISGIIWGIWHVPLIVAGGYTSAAPVTVTTSIGSRGLRVSGPSTRPMSASVASMSTADTPAPTAASVKATSTASSTTNSVAETRL